MNPYEPKSMSIADIWDEAVVFAEHSLPRLGYDEVSLWEIIIKEDRIFAKIYCEDTFQSRVPYDHRKQHGGIEFPYPFTTRGMLNREQRELHVLAAQTANSTAIADAMTSAAGRRFAQELVESRQRFAALCDWSERDA